MKPKGGKRKSAGRPKGSRNKVTAAANATLTALAQGYTEHIEADVTVTTLEPLVARSYKVTK